MTGVHDATYDLLRRHGVTTIFGNPGSNDQTSCRSSRIFRQTSAISSACTRALQWAWLTGTPAVSARLARNARVVLFALISQKNFSS
jgi:thiamine pyrophosphate-dependent acetolactate synthase large subunit-like protein